MELEQLSLFPKGKLSFADLKRIIGRMPLGFTRRVCECALKVAAANQDFTAEDVRMHCEPALGSENAMLEARRLGIFEVTGYRKANRAQAKSRIIPVYRRNF